MPAQSRPLIIEGYEEAPLKWMENGQIQGIDIDIMTEVMHEMAIADYEFRLVDNGRRLLHNAQLGQNDIVLTLSQNTEREQFLMYPRQAHLILDWRFAVRREDRTKIHFNSFDDIKPYRVGAAAGYSYTPAFWDSGLDIETVARSDLLIPMLLEKRLDLVPVNYLGTLYETGKTGQRDKLAFIYPPLRRAPYYNAFSIASDYPEKKAFLTRYDQIITAMRQDGRMQKIMEKYLGSERNEWWQSQNIQ